MIRLRGLWFQLHKWLGICLAVLIIPLSLSGAALVWHEWIDRQVHQERYPSAGQASLAPSVYAAGAMKLAEQGERVSAIVFPGKTGGVQVTLTKPSSSGGRPSRAMVWLDPRTAAPIERGGSRDGILGVLHVLHGTLMLGPVGRQIVGGVGVAMLLSSVTGLWLWWPLKGSLIRGLRWKRRPDFNSNLHHTGGFWIAVPLAVLSATGVWISFPSIFNPASGAPGPTQPVEATKLNPDQALAAAQSLASGRAASIAWPTERKAEWSVTLEGSGESVEVSVQDSNGSARFTPAKPEAFFRLMRRIHDGTGMHVVWQIIIFAGGILPAVLAVTGILMWLRMRRRREKHRRGSAALSDTEVLAS